MYKCCDCGYIFEEPKTYHENRTPSCGFEPSFIETLSGCPKCESAYERVFECAYCGKYFKEYELDYNGKDYICDDCYYENN